MFINCVSVTWLFIILGAGTALLGKEAAMACTVAVETAIGEHYDRYKPIVYLFA